MTVADRNCAALSEFLAEVANELPEEHSQTVRVGEAAAISFTIKDLGVPGAVRTITLRQALSGGPNGEFDDAAERRANFPSGALDELEGPWTAFLHLYNAVTTEASHQARSASRVWPAPLTCVFAAALRVEARTAQSVAFFFATSWAAWRVKCTPLQSLVLTTQAFMRWLQYSYGRVVAFTSGREVCPPVPGVNSRKAAPEYPARYATTTPSWLADERCMLEYLAVCLREYAQREPRIDETLAVDFASRTQGWAVIMVPLLYGRSSGGAVKREWVPKGVDAVFNIYTPRARFPAICVSTPLGAQRAAVTCITSVPQWTALGDLAGILLPFWMEESIEAFWHARGAAPRMVEGHESFVKALTPGPCHGDLDSVGGLLVDATPFSNAIGLFPAVTCKSLATVSLRTSTCAHLSTAMASTCRPLDDGDDLTVAWDQRQAACMCDRCEGVTACDSVSEAEDAVASIPGQAGTVQVSGVVSATPGSTEAPPVEVFENSTVRRLRAAVNLYEAAIGNGQNRPDFALLRAARALVSDARREHADG